MKQEWQCQQEAGASLAVEFDELSTGAELRNDADIAVAVTRALLLSGGLSGNRVQGLVDHGVVTLCGEVERDAQRETASVVVRWLHGVAGIVNLIGVVPPCRHQEGSRSSR